MCAATAATKRTGEYIVDSNRIAAPLHLAVESGEVHGVAAAADGVIFEQGFGIRDVETGAEMMADTVFWIASMTKAVTGACEMQLVEQGKLSLDGDIAGLLPPLSRVQVLEGLAADGSPRLRAPKRAITMRGRETESGRMEKSAVLALVPKQKVSIVEREGPGWTVWLDSQGDGDCPICGTGLNSRHGSYVRPFRDLPAQGNVDLDPGHATGRLPAPGATLHTSQDGMWGDRHEPGYA
jgi:hypothetical protein